MTADTAITIHEALENVRDAQKRLTRFRMENAAVVGQLEALDGQAKEAREELAQAIADNGTDYIDDPAGEFQIIYRRVRGYYDPAKLPAHIQDDPSIVQLKVTNAAIDKAIRQRRVSATDVEPAWVSDPGKPSVTVKPIAGG